MSDNRLTALDASFLEVESPAAHMHVGWAALFKPPAGRSVPGFEELLSPGEMGFDIVQAALSGPPRPHGEGGA